MGGEKEPKEELLLRCQQGGRCWEEALGCVGLCAAFLGTSAAPEAGRVHSLYRTGSPGSGKVPAKASTSSFSAFSSFLYFSSFSFSLNSFSVALGFMSFCTCSVSSIPAGMEDVMLSAVQGWGCSPGHRGGKGSGWEGRRRTGRDWPGKPAWDP